MSTEAGTPASPPERGTSGMAPGRDPEPSYPCCPTCGYPPRHRPECDNPGCTANPDVSESQKAAWAETKAKRDAEEAERERVRAIRRRMIDLGHG